MKKLSTQKAIREVLTIALVFISTLVWAGTTPPPPVFIDPVPEDTTINCVNDFPEPISLTAMDDMGMTFSVPSVDTPPPETIDPCIGGVVTRTWTAIDGNGLSTTVSQIITILPDNTAPVIMLAEARDTVSCELNGLDAVSNPLRYDVWINTLRLALPTFIDECSGVSDISDNAPASFESPCNTLNVTFVVTDNCGMATAWIASYTVIDTVPPVLMGTPNDTIIGCEAEIPPVANVTAADNCTGLESLTFNSFSTQITDGSCQNYEYNISRTWLARDSCGNSTQYSQLITIRDEAPPSFTAPDNLSISCDMDASDVSITGTITDLSDNCTPVDDIDVSFSNDTIPGTCPNNYIISRTWRARDACNNTRSQIQSISVYDIAPPTFTAPNDIVVDCSEAIDLLTTGVPIDVSDNCSDNTNIEVLFSDVVIAGSCLYEYQIQRTWTVTDECGNANSAMQLITVKDTIAPTFQSLPQDMVVYCGSGMDADQLFNNWVASFGGATAIDNCSAAAQLIWAAYDEGTMNAPSLPAISCPSPDSVLRKSTVTFEVEDECGNLTSVNATFSYIDDIPPVVRDCPEDIVLTNTPGSCSAPYNLPLPTFEDNCTSSSSVLSISGSAPITSNAIPGEESTTPVLPAMVEINVGQPLPINSQGDGLLSVHLSSANAFEDSEYFTIIGEQGEIIGITGHSPAICGDADTTLTVPASWINSWAADGVITLSFEPNIPADPRYAINPICNPAGSITATLDFTAGGFDNLVFEYSIDGNPRVVGDFQGSNIAVIFGVGSHLVSYYITDCAQNVDSCSYTISIEDVEAPNLTCVPDKTLYLAEDSCTASYQLPLPSTVIDNCGIEGSYYQQQPLVSPNALLTYSLDPNLGDFVADPKSFVFTGVAANSFQTVLLVIDLRGDFDSSIGYMEIYGENNTLLGDTKFTIADCNIPDQLIFAIPSATFNEWASDGQVEINAIPVPVPVPPGVPGDGINPCNPALVTMDGDNDGSSFMYATLSYQKLLIDYYTDGALTTPTTPMQEPQVETTLDFPLGQTQVHYIIGDESGNLDTCFYTVTVLDTIAPVALCVDATTLFIEPSGLQEEVINPESLDLGSYDNCGITSLSLSPSTFTCDNFGVLSNATLTVADASGNEATCTTIVTTSPILPMPTANSGLCGGDTLYLQANPPNSNSGNIYTFEWRDPSGQVFSTDEDTFIPNIDANNEGAYSVTIRGLTGCSATGAVFVSIQDLPLTPNLFSKSTICDNEDLRLESDNFPVGTDVVFYWYEGIPPMGTLIDSTTTPFLDITAPHLVGNHNYFLRIKATGCVSAPSDLWVVNVVQQPVALVSFSDTIVCEGSIINIGTEQSQSGLTYLWEGPDTYSSTNQYPEVGPLRDIIDEGYYKLTLIQGGGCVSEPDSVLIGIKPQPQTPNISSNSPICEGETLTLFSTSGNASAYHWQNASGQVFTTTTPSYVIPNASVTDEGDWKLFITQNGCESDISSPTTVIVNNRPQADASVVPQRVCNGNDFQLLASPDGENYEWSGPGINTLNNQNPVISNASMGNTGQYTLVVTSDAGCADTSFVAVEVVDRISILGVSSDATSCLDGTTDIQLTVSVFPLDDGTYNYQWSGPSSYSSNSNPAVIPGATAAAYRGDYYLTVTSSDNCETVLSTPFFLDVRDIPPTPSVPAVVNGTTSHCEGDSLVLTTNNYVGNNVAYYWELPGGSLVSTPINKLVVQDVNSTMHTGNYTVYVIVDGCVSATSNPVFVTVHQPPIVEAISNSPVCDGDLIEFTTTFYENASYVWGGPDNFNAGIQSPTFLSSNQSDSLGTYFVVVTQDGCASDTSFVEVAVKPIPQTPMVADEVPDSLCASENGAVLALDIATESSTNGAVYNWYNNINSAPINNSPSADGSITITDLSDYDADALYPFYVQAELNGCFSEFSPPHNILINSIPAISAFAGIDSVICDNQVVTLNAEAPSVGSGLWSYEGVIPGVSIANPMQAQTAVDGLTVEDSPFTFRWTLSNGACLNYDFDDVIIAVGEGEEPLPGDNIIACRDELINLGATPVSGVNSTGEWSQLIGQVIAGVEIVEPSNPTTEVTGLLPNNIYSFTWTVTNDCGERSADIIVYISDPFPNAGEDVIFCNEDATGILQAQEPTLGSVGRWRALNPEVQIMDDQSDTTMVSNLQEGDNLFVWTIDDGICGEASSDTVNLIYKLPPVAVNDLINVPFDTPISFDVLANDEISGAANASVSSDPIRGNAKADESDITYTPPPNYVGPDQFFYQINSEGCPTVTGEVNLIIGKGVGCDIPSIFTPNGDGINDNFVIPCLLDADAYPKSSVIIFNKWGDEVYRSEKPYKNNWTGTYNGEDLPPDTYFYVVDPGNGDEPYSGFIMIQK